MMVIKGFIGTIVGTVLGGEAIRQIGNVSGFPKGLKSVAQVGIALGVLGNAARHTKTKFKFK